MLGNTLMRSSVVVVKDIVFHHTLQVRLIHDQNIVQTFFANRSHSAFGMGIGVGCSIRYVNDLDTHRLNDGVKYP